MPESIRNFSRDTDAAIRLYLQHWIFKFEAGFLLHPLISTSQTPQFKVLDVGCGTGLWLLDLATLFPNAQLEGFDLSSSHFPPQSGLPKNVKLWQQDVCKPVPEALIGQYDLIHVARLHMYIGDGDLAQMVGGLKSMLKPGGFLQWDELDAPGMHAARRDSSQQYPAFEAMQRHAKSWMNSQNTTTVSVNDIPKLLETQGFKLCDHKGWEVSTLMSKPWTDMQLIANRDYHENLIVPMLQKMGIESSEIEAQRQLRHQVEAEVAERGLQILMDMQYTVAQKSE